MREFLDTAVKGGGGIPVANSLCQHNVSKVYNKQQANIMEQLKEKKVAVIVDETTDVMGRYVVNVLLQSLDAFAGADNCRPLLVNTVSGGSQSLNDVPSRHSNAV